MPNQLIIRTISGTEPKPNIICARMKTAGMPNPMMPRRYFLFWSFRNWFMPILGCETVVV